MISNICFCKYISHFAGEIEARYKTSAEQVENVEFQPSEQFKSKSFDRLSGFGSY